MNKRISLVFYAILSLIIFTLCSRSKGYEERVKLEEALSIKNEELSSFTLPNFSQICDSITKYKDSDYEKANVYIDQLILDPTIDPFSIERGQAYYFKAHTLNVLVKNYREALNYYELALIIFENHNFYKDIGDCYIGMGASFYSTELYDLAIEYNQKAILYYTKSNSDFKKAKSFYNLGLAYNANESYVDAEKNQLDALAIMQNLKEEKWVAGIYNQLGVISENQKKYDHALMYYTMAMAINQKIGYKEGLANVYNNMAEIHKEVYNDFDEAMNCYKKSIAIEKKLNNEKGIAITLYNIGLTQSTLHRYQEALSYFNQSQVLAEKVGDKKQLELLAREFVKVHQQLGNANKASMYSNKYSALNKFNNNEELKEMLEKYDQKCELRGHDIRFRLLRQEKELFKQQGGEIIKN